MKNKIEVVLKGKVIHDGAMRPAGSTIMVTNEQYRRLLERGKVNPVERDEPAAQEAAIETAAQLREAYPELCAELLSGGPPIRYGEEMSAAELDAVGVLLKVDTKKARSKAEKIQLLDAACGYAAEEQSEPRDDPDQGEPKLDVDGEPAEEQPDFSAEDAVEDSSHD